MEATMGNFINKNSKVISAAALLLTLSACGQGFKTRQHQELDSNFTNVQNFSAVRTPAANVAQVSAKPAAVSPKATPAAPSSTPVPPKSTPVAANDNEQLTFRFITLNSVGEAKVAEKFKHVDPKREINTKLLKNALAFFYVNQANFRNKDVITVIDYSRPSSSKRLYVIELGSGRVWSTYVAHGRGSDKNHDGLPEVFNNKLNSFATSVGPYITLGSYRGEHGLSLRLKGLSKYNSNAYKRNVVIHGASYVRDEASKQGRSLGCPAVAQKYTKKLINAIKGGSLVYAGASQPSIHRQL